MSSVILVVLLLALSCTIKGDTNWQSCDGVGISFKHFTLFPNPVAVGQSVHGLAVITLTNVNPGDVQIGSINVDILYNKASVFTLTNIPLCNSTNAIVCNTLSAGDNTVSFDFQVPKILAGDYTVKFTGKIGQGASLQMGCLTFDISVVDPTQDGYFRSYIQASLAGSAQFENTDYLARGLGDIVQVGPVGPVPTIYSSLYQWGTFLSVEGSQDSIASFFNPANYVWGMNGSMVAMRYHNTTRQQTYQGVFTVGYVTSLSNRAMDVVIVEGTFNLTWSYKTENGKISSNLTGTIMFDDIATLPTSWSRPFTLGRYGILDAETNSEGTLIVSGSKDYCATDSACKRNNEEAIRSSTTGKKSNSSLSDRNLGLIIGLCIGIPLVLILLVALFLYRRHRKHYEEEAGIFNAARKPEYGNALVVDDIIQETREHGGNNTLIPRLDRHPGDTHSNYNTESEDQLSQRGRGRERSLSPDSRSEFSESEEEHSRPPPRYRSRSPGEYYSDESRSDAGSSASRSSEEDD